MKKLNPKRFSFLWNKRAFTLLVFALGAIAIVATYFLVVAKAITFISIFYMMYVILSFKDC